MQKRMAMLLARGSAPAPRATINFRGDLRFDGF
jgi:hypothetical protein